MCAVQDINMDVTTAGSIAESLRALREGCTDQAVMEVVTLMATKPMKVCPALNLPPLLPPPPLAPFSSYQMFRLLPTLTLNRCHQQTADTHSQIVFLSYSETT